MTKPLIMSIGSTVEYIDDQGQIQTTRILDVYLDQDDEIQYHVGGGQWREHKQILYRSGPTIETLRKVREENCLLASLNDEEGSEDEYDICEGDPDEFREEEDDSIDDDDWVNEIANAKHTH